MDEVWQEQQERGNESGIDLCEQWNYEQSQEEKQNELTQ